MSIETQALVGQACGARANGGHCILPRGHNRGNVDIPEMHESAVWKAGPGDADLSFGPIWDAYRNNRNGDEACSLTGHIGLSGTPYIRISDMSAHETLAFVPMGTADTINLVVWLIKNMRD